MVKLDGKHTAQPYTDPEAYLAELQAFIDALPDQPGEVEKFDPGQPRDESGKWTDAGGGGAASLPPAGKPFHDREGQRFIDSARKNDNEDEDYTAPRLKANIVKTLGDKLRADPQWDAMREKLFAPPGTDDAVNTALRTWASTAADHDSVSLGLQLSAANEFKLDGSLTDALKERTGNDEVWRDAQALSQNLGRTVGGTAPLGVYAGPVQRMVLRAMYDHTQNELSRAGVDEVTLYRGLTEPPKDYLSGDYADEKAGQQWRTLRDAVGGSAPVRSNPLSSWTSRKDTARSFARGSSGEGVVLAASFPRERIISTPLTGLGCFGEAEWVVLGHPDDIVEVQAP